MFILDIGRIRKDWWNAWTKKELGEAYHYWIDLWTKLYEEHLRLKIECQKLKDENIILKYENIKLKSK